MPDVEQLERVINSVRSLNKFAVEVNNRLEKLEKAASKSTKTGKSTKTTK